MSASSTGLLSRMMCCCRCACKGPVGLRPFLFGSKLNVLFFICGPLAFVSETSGWGEGPSFVLAMLAIAPLAERLGFLTEQLAFHTNDTLGGMLNATFGNSVETLISVVALMKAKDSFAQNDTQQAHFFLTLVQTSLLGSMLSNLLLVQGSAFFLGGLRHPMQTFSRDGAITSAGLLVMAVLALSVPTMLWTQEEQVSPTNEQLALSRFVSICLLIIYICFLLFQLRTHRFLFEKASEIHKALDFERGSLMNIIPVRNRQPEENFEDIELGAIGAESHTKTATVVTSPELNDLKKQELATHGNVNGAEPHTAKIMPVTSETIVEEDVTRMPVANGFSSVTRTSSPSMNGTVPAVSVPSLTAAPGQQSPVRHDAQIGLVFALLYLFISTVAVAFVSHVVVDAAEGAVDSLNLNPIFVGGVVVPIVGNAAEHVSALMFAWRDKMDTALAIAVGSAIQIPLFVLPVCVMVGWAAGVPLTLNLDQFMMTVVVVTSLALAFTLHAGSSHWLHGLILVFEYLIISAAFWFA